MGSLSNTQKRIISAFILVGALVLCVALGRQSTIAFMGLFGLVSVHEVLLNFLNKNIRSRPYLVSMLSYATGFVYLNYVEVMPQLFSISVNAALVFEIYLIYYLFKVTPSEEGAGKLRDRAYLIGLFFLIPMIALTNIIHLEKWIHLVSVLCVVNFGMDTGAWFFGKNFGKHKLWEAVSPNKTIEGLLGGMLTSAVLGTLAWKLSIGHFKPELFVIFALLGAFSQIGDLVQSKLKRQFGVKDSSQLIPGHGGFFDRIDSLIFMGPLFSFIIGMLEL